MTSIILLYGWRDAFWFCALVGTLAAAVWCVVARDTPEQHPWVSREEVAMIASGRGDVKREAALAEAERKAGVPWMRIFSSKKCWR